MLLHGPRRALLARSSAAIYTGVAVSFNGSNQYLSRASALTNVVDGKVGIFSFGVKFNGGDGVRHSIFGDSNTRFLVDREADNRFRLFVKDAGGSVRVRIFSTNTVTADGKLHHVVFAWDVATPGSGRCYIDGVDVSDVQIYTNAALDYTNNYGLAARQDGSNKLGGCLAQVYANFAEYLDLDANLAALYDGALVDIGGDGSSVTGTAPVGGYWANPAATFQNDLSGNGNNFTVNGGPLSECTL